MSHSHLQGRPLNSLTKLSALLFFALLVPLPSQAQQQPPISVANLLGIKEEDLRDMATSEKLPSRTSPNSVPVRFMGREAAGDTTLQMSNDSAAALLKATRAQVFFLDHVRSSKQKVARLTGDNINGIEVAYGDPLISQYGDVAKNGVITVVTNVQNAKEKAEADERKAQAKGRARRAKQP